MRHLHIKYAIGLILSLISTVLYAGHEKGIESFKGSTIFAAAQSSTYDNTTGDITNKNDAMYLDIIDHSYQEVRYTANWASYISLSNISNDVVLRFDDLQRQDFQADWSMTVEYTIYFNADQSFGHYEKGELEISYNHQANYIDQQRKVFTTFGGTGLAHEGLNPRVYIREATFTGNATDQTLFTTGDIDVYFDLELHTEKCYILQGDDLRAEIKNHNAFTFANTVDYDYAEVTWGYVEGAESYELEWLFVDLGLPTDETSTIGTTLTDYPNFKYDFDNAFGIIVQENTFKIPLHYPTGILMYRIRPIGYSDCDTKVYGDWNTALNKGEIHNLSSADYIVINGFEMEKNWQSSSTFIEGGKHADAITYYDGSFRPRQSIAVNKEANIGVVNTPVFDHSGRSTLSLAPFAVENNSLKYKTNITEYPRSSFDANGTIGSPLDYTPQMGELSASEYYSSGNTFTHSHKDYIPDAGNQPFSRTLLKNDGTNRVKEQGGMGPDFQIGSGKTTKHYYYQPSQNELDALFGNDVGYAENYSKHIIVDPNGQGTYQVMDVQGKVIVSGLYGEAPSMLDPLPESITAPTELITLDISDQNYVGSAESKLFYGFDLASQTDQEELYFDYEFGYAPAHNADIVYTSSSVDGITYTVSREFSLDLTLLDAGTLVPLTYSSGIDVQSTTSISGSSPVSSALPNGPLVYLPGSYYFDKTLKPASSSTISNVVSDFQNYLNPSVGTSPIAVYVDYQVCGCKEECIGNYLGNDYWFIPTGQLGNYYPHLTTNAGSYEVIDLTSVGMDEYYIIRTSGQSAPYGLTSGQITTENPFLDGTTPSNDIQLFKDNIIHCSYACDFPDEDVFQGFRLLANQVYPGVGEYWNLDDVSNVLSEYEYWIHGIASTTSFNSVFSLVDENGVAIDIEQYLDPSATTLEEKMIDFSTVQWENDDFWDNFENQWFKLPSSPYTYENISSPIVMPLTKEYFLKYILIPEHPEFNLLNNLFTEPFVSFDNTMVNNTVFVPFNTAQMPTGVSSYYTDYNFIDPLTYSSSVSLSNLPLQNLSLTLPTNIYDIETVLEDFQGSGKSVYHFMDNTGPAGSIQDKFHGSSTVGKGLFNHNVSKEDFFEKLYADLRTTKHFATYFANTSNPLTAPGTVIIPSTTYTYNSFSNLSPVVDLDFIWANMNEDLVTMSAGSLTSIDPYLNGIYLNASDNETIFMNGLERWFNDNIFLKPRSVLASEFFQTATPVEITNYAVRQTTLNSYVNQEYQNRLTSYLNTQISVNYNSTTSEYELTLNSGTVLYFDIADFETHLFGTGSVFEDFETYFTSLPSIVSDVISNNATDFTGYAADQTACETFLNANMASWDTYIPNCTGNTTRQTEIKDAFVSNDYFLYHFDDDNLSVFTGDCPFVDHYDAYVEFAIELGKADCYCNELKEIALPHVTAAYPSITLTSEIESSHLTNNSNEIALLVLEDLGLSAAQSTAVISNFVTNIINSATSGSCFSNQPSVNNLDLVGNNLVYNLLCDVYEIEAYTNAPCAALSQAEIDDLNTSLFNITFNALVSDFKNWYSDKLFVGIMETIEYTFPQKQYQQTLYYYDQVGNLVKTVSPEGKATLSAQELQDVIDFRTQGAGVYTVPAHDATEYVYNALNQMVSKNTPDQASSTYFHYDETGRLIASQSPRQKSQTDILDHDMSNHENYEHFSYTLFDDLGRIKESGVAEGVYASLSVDYDLFETYILTLDRREVSKIHYDEPTPIGVFDLPFEQEFLRNRVAWKEYYPVLSSNTTSRNDDKYYEDAYSKQFYGYDVHGNVNHYLVEHRVSEVSSISKYMTYTYDLISGNVLEFAYQPGELDQFYHRYYYDESNRLIEAESSDDNMIWETEAKYFYYPHGPLARVELGEKQVQGTDYAYTLHGWLKAVNGIENDRQADMSKDGQTGTGTNMNRNAEFAQDELSYKIDYFNGDYNPIVANTALSTFNGDASLYNGNIAAIDYDISDLDPVNYRYRYDQLQRLKRMDSYNYSGGNTNYGVQLTYDKNGNILNLLRSQGHTGLTLMDNIDYIYTGLNQLQLALDDIDHPNVDNDYESSNYGTSGAPVGEKYYYDKDGNEIYKYLSKPNYNGHRANRWFSSGKVKSTSDIFKDPTNSKDPWRLNFFYDGDGSRIAKVLKYSDDTPYLNPELISETEVESNFETEDTYTYTYYINDPTGNTIATYKHKFDDSSTPTVLNEELDHFNIYGSSRLGTVNRGEVIKRWDIINGGGNLFSNDTKLYENILSLVPVVEDAEEVFSRELGDKNYELSNHLGNVLATVSDRKKKNTIGVASNGFYKSDMRSYSDYYPFGMQMPGRKVDADGYRYGFQGQEVDNEIKGEGNSVNYKYRMHDPRLGRFFAVDPLAPDYPHNSPYAFSENRVIDGIELEGAEYYYFMNIHYAGQGQPKLTLVRTQKTLPHPVLEGLFHIDVEIPNELAIYVDQNSGLGYLIPERLWGDARGMTEAINSGEYGTWTTIQDVEMTAAALQDIAGKIGALMMMYRSYKFANMKVRDANINKRHYLSSDRIASSKKTAPSTMAPKKILDKDLASYQKGNFSKTTNGDVKINGRIYGVKNEGATIFPRSGGAPEFIDLTQGQIKAIQLAKKVPADKLSKAFKGAGISQQDADFAKDFISNY